MHNEGHLSRTYGVQSSILPLARRSKRTLVADESAGHLKEPQFLRRCVTAIREEIIRHGDTTRQIKELLSARAH